MNSINNSSSDEHEELLAEMELIERLPTQERLKQAKRRRALQLKKWLDYDREILLKGMLYKNIFFYYLKNINTNQLTQNQAVKPINSHLVLRQ